MRKQHLRSIVMGLSLAALAACGGTPYTPVASKSDPIDVSAYKAKVDSFVVLLDTSGSMNEADQGTPRINNAADWVASFNSAVPPLGYKAGMVTFGKGSTGTCIGYGVATTIYGLAPYQSADFGKALGSIECAASTTPIADAIDATTGMLVDETGPIAVIIVSDFNWNDPDAVTSALAALKEQHAGKICLHTVKVGNDTSHDAMISSITDTAACDSAVSADAVASGATLTSWVADTLLVATPMQYEKHTVSAEVLFDFDKSVLKEQGKVELQRLGGLIKEQGMKVGDIDVVGHTDSVGTPAYNQGLSVRRAMAVKDYLVSEGVNGAIIDAMGMGESQPVASNDTAAGRAMNRRVDVLVGTTREAK